VLTEREHATILAALRYVARHGGFRDTIEAGIAASGGQWDMMSPDEIDALGDHFNLSSDPGLDVRLRWGRSKCSTRSGGTAAPLF
jgi:hypothetical protein